MHRIHVDLQPPYSVHQLSHLMLMPFGYLWHVAYVRHVRNRGGGAVCSAGVLFQLLCKAAQNNPTRECSVAAEAFLRVAVCVAYQLV